MRKLILGLVLFLGACGSALADDWISGIVNEACANNGEVLTQIIAWLGGIVGGASVLANFRNHLPLWFMPAIDWLALNWVKHEHDEKPGANGPQPPVAAP